LAYGHFRYRTKQQDSTEEGLGEPPQKDQYLSKNNMALQLRNGPQSRAPLKWGGGAKNLTARRHPGCLTKVPDGPQLETKNVEEFRIGTWNVRTLRTRGKLENIKREMKGMKLDVLGLSECRWPVAGDFISDDFRVIHSGSEGGQKGVAVILGKEVGRRVTKVVQHSDRLLLIRLKAEPVDVVLLQVYMPTSNAADEEIEHMYEEIESLVTKEKATDQVIIMGDFNAVVGEGKDGREIGEFGLGKRNDRGQTSLDFCKRTRMIVTNTWFEHEKRRRYTWKRPGDTGRFQIDYILIKHRYRNSVKNSRAYPGADANTDHNLVMAKIRLKLKKIPRSRNVKRWRLKELNSKKGRFNEELGKEVAKYNDSVDGNIDNEWIKLRETIKNGAEKVFGYQNDRRAKKPWITDKMLEKIDERRKWKNSNTEDGKKKYRCLNNELRRETDKAREDWWEARCDELVEYDKRGRTDLLYFEVSRLTRTENKSTIRNVAVNDKNGELLTEIDEVKNRWKEYIEDLYNKSKKPKIGDFCLEDEGQVDCDDRGPGLLTEEIYAAIAEMKNGKAAGVDDIPAEFLKLLEGKTMQKLVDLCKEIYEKGIWPEDFTRIVMIPIPKKTNATECADYRTISIISHASKIVLKILTKRLESKVKSMISKTQFGFRKGCGTREAIGVMRTLCERSLQRGNEIFICFVDFEKAFDRVDWVRLLQILKEVGIDWKDRRLITNLYMQQKTVIKVGQEYSEESDMGRGVRQGCCLSPLLFTVYAEFMMMEAMEGIDEGIKVGGKLLKDVRFADDQGMIAGTEKGLQKSMDSLNTTADKYGMKINIKKTKVMRVSKKIGGKVKIEINGNRIEQVKSFKYLGSTITEDGRCESEIKIRIALAKEAFSKRKELFTKSFRKDLKKKIVKTLVWTTLLYGCETWTLKQVDISRLEAAEMWMWRKMEKIKWTDKIRNEEVLRRVEEKEQLVNLVWNRKRKWIGHVLRGDGILKEVIEGSMEGKNCVGAPRKGMLSGVIVGNYAKTKRMAEDRESWRSGVPWTCH